jgi:DNA-directed RNA polymerase subunit F
MSLEKNLDPMSLVHMNMKWTMLNKIEEIRHKNKFKYRSDAINYLLDLSIKFLEKIENTPPEKLHHEIEEIDAQLKEGGVVDYIARMNGKDLKNLYKIISEEYQFRTEK